MASTTGSPLARASSGAGAGEGGIGGAGSLVCGGVKVQAELADANGLLEAPLSVVLSPRLGLLDGAVIKEEEEQEGGREGSAVSAAEAAAPLSTRSTTTTTTTTTTSSSSSSSSSKGLLSPLSVKLSSSFRRGLSTSSTSTRTPRQQEAAMPEWGGLDQEKDREEAEAEVEEGEFSRELSLQVSLATIDELQQQLHTSNRQVEAMAAEVVALQRELAAARAADASPARGGQSQRAARSPSSSVPPQAASPQRPADVSYRSLHVERLQASHHRPHQARPQHHHGAPRPAPASPLAPSPLSPQSPGASSATSITATAPASPKSATSATCAAHAELQLQRIIEANTAALLSYMDRLSRSGSGGGAGLPAHPEEQARLVGELRAAVAGMGELQRELAAVLEEQRRVAAGHQQEGIGPTAATAAVRALEAQLQRARAATEEGARGHEAREKHLAAELQRLKEEARKGLKAERALLEEVRAAKGEGTRWRKEAHQRGVQLEACRQELEALKAVQPIRRRGLSATLGSQSQSYRPRQTTQGGTPRQPLAEGGDAVEGGPQDGLASLSAVDFVVLQQHQQQLEEEQAREREAAQRLVVALQSKVEALEAMLRTQMQIKATVVHELRLKNDEVAELRAQLGLAAAAVSRTPRVANAAKAKTLRETVALRKGGAKDGKAATAPAAAAATGTATGTGRSSQASQTQRSGRGSSGRALLARSSSVLASLSSSSSSSAAFRMTSASALATEAEAEAEAEAAVEGEGQAQREAHEAVAEVEVSRE